MRLGRWRPNLAHLLWLRLPRHPNGDLSRWPRTNGLAIYRLDIDLRHSTVVGIVGARWFGITLLNSSISTITSSACRSRCHRRVVLVGEGVSDSQERGRSCPQH